MEARTMNEVTNEEKKMTIKEYVIRLIIWIIVLTVAPIVYLEVNYGLFTNRTGTSLSAWGVIGVAFLASVFLYILNQVKNGMKKGSMARQCIEGYVALIPMIAVIVFIHYIQNSIEKMEGFLVIVAVCQLAAVPINPNPKWSEQNDCMSITDMLKTAFTKIMGDKK